MEFDGEVEREREQDERVVNDPIYTVTLGVPIDPTNQPTSIHSIEAHGSATKQR